MDGRWKFTLFSISMYSTSYILVTIVFAKASLSTPNTDLQPELQLRRKRILSFPDRADLTLTMSLLKATLFESTLNTLHEMDILFPLPRNLFTLIFLDQQRSHDRYVIYSQIEAVFETFGFNGMACLSRMICEVKHLNEDLLKRSFVLQIIYTILTMPKSLKRTFDLPEKNYGNQTTKSCKNYTCPISLFSPLLLKM